LFCDLRHAIDQTLARSGKGWFAPKAEDRVGIVHARQRGRTAPVKIEPSVCWEVVNERILLSDDRPGKNGHGAKQDKATRQRLGTRQKCWPWCCCAACELHVCTIHQALPEAELDETRAVRLLKK
jgi:hypothetical protein